jgi:hypothetical protein
MSTVKFVTVALFLKVRWCIMNVLSKSEERSSLLQDVDIIGILLAFIGLIEACVKLADTIINTRSSKRKSKKKRKKNAKK